MCQHDHDSLPTLAEAGADSVTILALTAMRFLANGYVTGDVACWDAAYEGAERILGPRDGHCLVAGATGVMRAIRTERAAGWAFMPPSCGRVTSDEFDLVRTLMAARDGRPHDFAAMTGRLAGLSRGVPRILAALHVLADLLDRIAPALEGRPGPTVPIRPRAAGIVFH